MEKISINIAGDIYLGSKIASISNQNPQELFDDGLIKLFENSDYNIINLESAITQAGEVNKIVKTGPHLKADPKTLSVLHTLKVDLTTLANNHIFDYGEKGLSDTFEHLIEEKIDFVGAGNSLKEAQSIFRFNIREKRFSVVNFSENEWSNANRYHGGANPMDIISNANSIKSAKESSDFVFVIVHGGHENYQYPSPRMVKQYRFYAEQGADLVICHHAHRTSGFEFYKGVPIFYGIGNFLFHSDHIQPGWNNGIVVNVLISDKSLTWNIHPYNQCLNTTKVELLQDEEKINFLNELEELNKVILDQDKLQQEFDKFSNTNTSIVLSMLSNSNIVDNRYFKSAIRRLKLEKFFLRREQMKSIFNYVNCESHRDTLLNVVNSYLKK